MKGANFFRCVADEGANLGVVERWRGVPTPVTLEAGARCQLGCR